LAEGLAARARLDQAMGAEPDPRLAQAFDALGRGRLPDRRDAPGALGAAEDAERQDLIRQAMVGIFAELGADNEPAREHRRRLAAALN
jgi:hypothetical protein